MSEKFRGAVGFSSYVKKSPGILAWFLRFVGKCIRFFTKSVWTHTFVCLLDDDVLGPLTIEACEINVTVNFMKDYGYLDPDQYRVEIWMPKATDDRINAGLLRVSGMNGVSYGWFQLPGFILVWVWRKITGKTVNNPVTGGIICSELVIEYLKVVFPESEEIQKMDRNTTSPEDIYELRDRYFDPVPIIEPVS
jgi:hypothetical protein